MTTTPNRLASLVAAATTVYRHVSEALAKAMPVGAAYSTKRWPYDIGDGLLTRSAVFNTAGHFGYAERNLKPAGAVANLVANDEIVSFEFPTDARLLRIQFQRSIAAATDNPGTAVINDPTYFAASTAAGAFPQFDLVLRDPGDPSFAPITIASSGTATEGFLRVPTWLLFWMNRRKRPLLVSVKVAGAVPANSGVVVMADFVGPHI